jgi:hypothetical protein
MWMSEILVVVNSKNVDSNGLHDIAGAIEYLGGHIVEIDDAGLTVTATVPSSKVPTIHLIEGITYVRPTLTYYRQAG